jgi:dTDP-4-dehydrorhamnose reductase
MHHADTIINCAAMVGIDKCYEQQRAAVIANATWPISLNLAARSVGAQLIHFSTEAVFPCNTLGKIYGESDQPNPSTYYGKTKLVGECGAIVRLPLLFGPTNSKQIVAKLVRRLMRGEDVEAAVDLFSTPAYTPDVAKWLAWNLKPFRPLTHATGDRIISLYDLVKEIALFLKAPGRLKQVLASRFSSKEPKPLCGGLRSEFIPAFSLDGAVLKYAEWIKENRKEFLDGT